MISEIPKTPQQQGFSGFFFCFDNDLITGFSGAIILGSVGLRVDCRRIRTTPRALIFDGARVSGGAANCARPQSGYAGRYSESADPRNGLRPVR